MRINPGYVNGDLYKGPIVPVHPDHCTECTLENRACEYHKSLGMNPSAPHRSSGEVRLVGGR